MLIPSIDLLGGRIVQLVQGEKLRLAFDDFEYWIEKFSRFPLVQLIDLDAAMRQGDNSTGRANCQAAASPGRRRHPLHRTRPPGARRRRKARHHRLGALLCERAQSTPNLPLRWPPASAQMRGSRHRHQERPHRREGLEGASRAHARRSDSATRAHVAAFLYTHVDGEGLMQGFPIETAARCASSRSGSSSWPAAFAASRKWMRWTRWAPMPWWAWLSTRSCSQCDSRCETLRGYACFSPIARLVSTRDALSSLAICFR
jgi:phosphoribosylformimino-5-aminoimidazole carboxamide ribotide isomerase